MNNDNAPGNAGWTLLFKVQQKNSDRIDLTYVDGKLTDFKVKSIEEMNGKYKVRYEGQAANMCCMIDHIANEMPVLTPQNYEVVTFKRAMWYLSK